MKAPTVDKLTKETTLTVTVEISKQFRLRLAIALFLIRMATKVLGCRLEVEEASNDTK